MDNKTAEQVLSYYTGCTINDDMVRIQTQIAYILKAMHEFAQHQTEALREENEKLRADNERMRAAIKIAATDCSLGMTGLDFTLKDIKNYLESILTPKD